MMLTLHSLFQPRPRGEARSYWHIVAQGCLYEVSQWVDLSPLVTAQIIRHLQGTVTS